MQSQEPGQYPGTNPVGAIGKKSISERLLSFVGPKTLFVVVGGGILVSAALVLTLISAVGPQDNKLVKGLSALAGYDSANPFGYDTVRPINGICPRGYRLQPTGKCTPMPQPPQPAPAVSDLRLTVSVNTTTVVVPGAYVLTATYTDSTGVVKKHSGQLEAQHQVCQLNNPNDCGPMGISPWLTLTDGQVTADLPANFAPGIYKASFRPIGTDIPWSNEIAVTVKPPSEVTPPAPVGPQKINVLSARAQSVYSSYEASNVIDESVNTMWNSGDFAPRWIELDLGGYYNLNKMRLNPAMLPDGQVTHVVTAGPCPTPTTQIGVVNEFWSNGIWKDVNVASGPVRYVRINTTVSPSWVAWLEIEAYGTPADYTSTCGGSGGGGGNPPPPPPTTCLPGSVLLGKSSIEVRGTTSVQSSLVGYGVVFDTEDHGIANILGSNTVSGVNAGATNVTGRYEYAGRTCWLTPARIAVTAQTPPADSSLNADSLVSVCPQPAKQPVTARASSPYLPARVYVTGGPAEGTYNNTRIITLSAANQEQQGTFDAMLAPGGGPTSYTINLVVYGHAELNKQTQVTTQLKTTGCAGSTPPTYSRFEVTPQAATVCPLSTKTVNVIVEGATAPGYVQSNDRYDLTGSGTSYGLSQSLGLGAPTSGQRTYTFTLNLTGGQPVSKQVVLTADSSACSQPTADFSVNPSTMNICPGRTGQVLITIYNPTSGGSVRRGDGTVIGSFSASPTSTLGMRDDITVTEAMIGTSYTYDLILNTANGGTINLHRGSTYFARPVTGCSLPAPTVAGFAAGPSNNILCPNTSLTVGFTVQGPSGPGRITGSNGTSFSFNAAGLVSPRTDTVQIGTAAGSVTYSLQIDAGNGVFVTPTSQNTATIGWTIKTTGCASTGNPAGTLSLDKGTTEGVGNTVYVTCGGGAAYFTVRATNTGVTPLTFSNGVTTKTIAVGGSDAIVDALGVDQNRAFTLQYNGQNVNSSPLAVNAIRNPICTPTVAGFTAGPSNNMVCPNTNLLISFYVQSPSGPGRITGSNGTSFTFGSNGVVSGRDTIQIGTTAGSVTYSLQIDTGNGVYVTPNSQNAASIGWSIKTSGCAPAQTPSGTVTVTGPTTNEEYLTCQSTVTVTIRVTVGANSPTLVFSGDGRSVSAGQSFDYTETVNTPMNSVTLKTYNLTYNGQVVAYDNVTIRRQLDCTPSGSITVSGGVANCTVNFAYVTVGMSNAIPGIYYEVRKNGASFATLTYGGTVPDTVNVGSTNTYSLYWNGQALGGSQQITGVRGPECSPTVAGFTAGPSNNLVCPNSNLTISFVVQGPSGPGRITGSNGTSFTFGSNGVVSGRDTIQIGTAAGSVTYSLQIDTGYGVYVTPNSMNTASIGWSIKTTGCTVPSPAGSLVFDRGTTAGTGNTVYLTCAGNAAYFSVRANNTGNVPLTFSNFAGQLKTIPAGGSDSISDALGLGQNRTFVLAYNDNQLVAGPLTIDALRDPACAQASAATLSVSPQTLPLCPGQSGTVTLTAAGTTYGGNFTQAGYGIVGSFNAPGGSATVSIIPIFIGQSVQFGGYQNTLNGPGPAFTPVSVQVTQAGNCAPSGTLTVSGGTVPCNSTNGLVNISVSGQSGVTYTVSRGGGWSTTITGSGSATDLVPLGSTYLYTLSANGQSIGLSQSVTGAHQSGCTPANQPTLNMWINQSGGSYYTVQNPASGAHVSWASTNATSCTINGGAWNALSGSSYWTGAMNPGQTITISGTCVGAAGTAPASAAVTITAVGTSGGGGGGGTIITVRGDITAYPATLSVPVGICKYATISGSNTSSDDSVVLHMSGPGGVNQDINRNQVGMGRPCLDTPGTYTYTLTGPQGFSKSISITVTR